MQPLVPRSVPPSHVKKWVTESLKLLARRPLEWLAITIAEIVVSTALSGGLPRALYLPLLVILAQLTFIVSTWLAIVADGRKIGVEMHVLSHLLSCAVCLHFVLLCVVLLFEISMLLIIDYHAIGQFYFQIQPLSIPIGIHEHTLIFNLWLFMVYPFVWPLLLDRGLLFNDALRLNQSGKMANLFISLLCIVFAIVTNFVPIIGAFTYVFVGVFCYVAYRDIFLGIEENAKVPAKSKSIFSPA